MEPAASLCRVAVDRGARLVIVNRDETPYDDIATAVIREPIGDVVPEIVRALVPIGVATRQPPGSRDVNVAESPGGSH